MGERSESTPTERPPGSRAGMGSGGASPRGSTGQRRIAWAVAIAVVVVVGILPVALDRDSFPLSTYPMFSQRRTATEVVDTAVGIDAGGASHRLSPDDIAGTDEVIAATAAVGDAIARGDADEFCAAIADRVDDDDRGFVAVEVVSERYDAIDWFDGDHTPIERIVQARCDVEVEPG